MVSNFKAVNSATTTICAWLPGIKLMCLCFYPSNFDNDENYL